MKSLDEYLELAGRLHGHLCAGQVLGVRMALHGLGLLGIDDPWERDRKRLITFVEIDRCMADAISVVTGCRLGRRALKFRDFGKVAATFCDMDRGRAVRLAAKESARDRARELYPDLETRRQQMAAYREMSDDELFERQWVTVRLNPEDLPGHKAAAVVCGVCGEAVKFGRERVRDGVTLCRSCAGESYYELCR